MRTGLMIVIALTVALLVIAPVVAVPEIEADLNARTAAALREQGHDWAIARAQGRTLVVSGEAPGGAARDAALALVEATWGVGDVVDQTTLAPAAAYVLTVTRTASGMSLGGIVPDTQTIEALRQAILAIDPRATVDDNVAVEAGPPDQGWQTQAVLAAQQAARLLAGQASIGPEGIEVVGSVGSESARAAVEEALAGITEPPVRIDLTVELPRTYALTVTRDGTGLTLAGEVPDEATRTALIALAERQRVQAVDADMLTVTPGVAAADWDSMARALVRHVGGMREGRAELAAGRLSVTGVVADPAMADVMQTALSAIFGNEQDIATTIDIQAAGAGDTGGESAITDVMAHAAEAPIPELTEDQRLDAGTCQSDLNRLTSDDRVRFLDGGAVIDPASLTLLEAVAVTLRACPGTNVEVSGHTDSSGDPAADEALSQRRAQAVVDYLVLRGVSGDRLVAAGYGDQIPVADNATEDGRVRNRRIEFLVELTQ